MSKRALMQRMEYDLELMLQMRREGQTFNAIARFFNKDHTTIIYQCHKYGAYPLNVVEKKPQGKQMNIYSLRYMKWQEAERKKNEKKPPHKYAHLLEEENMNQGKSYKEYLAEALKRPIEKRYHEIYYENRNFTGLVKGAAARLAYDTEEEGSIDIPKDIGLVP